MSQESFPCPEEGLERQPNVPYSWMTPVLSFFSVCFSGALWYEFRQGGPNYIKGLHHVYVYDLVISIFVLFGVFLFLLPCGQPIMIALASLLPILALVGFAWTEFENRHYWHHLSRPHLATLLVVFLGLTVFANLVGLIIEIRWFEVHGTEESTNGAVVQV